MAGYQVIEDNSKLKSILKIEGICPVCNHYPSRYLEHKDGTGGKKMKATRQMLYTCSECGSKWKGNIYDNMLNLA